METFKCIHDGFYHPTYFIPGQIRIILLGKHNISPQLASLYMRALI
jgi:hypothetical protein